MTTTTVWLPPRDPLAVYERLTERFGADQVYLLESAGGPDRDVRRQFVGFGELVTVAVTRGRVEVDGLPGPVAAVRDRVVPLLDATGDGMRLRAPGDLWAVLRAAVSTFDAPGGSAEFRFGFLTHLGYDAVRYIEDLPHLIDEPPDLPDVHLALHRGCIVTDLVRRRSDLVLHASDRWPDVDPDELRRLVAEPGPAGPAAEDVPSAEPRDDTARETYLAGVQRCHEHIAAGDVYQVQLGHEIRMDSTLPPLEAYRRLRARNASPYMYLTPLAGRTVVGASPELFVRVEDGLVTMRPIAGTVPRRSAHGDGAADDVAARRLRCDPKELAEHTMLVDLCRNDIGRICQPGSLAVPDELVVERFSHVQHLVSTVVGRAERDVDAYDVIAALFPAGTVTGTPKIRAMEVIESLESSRRGLYAGAVGLVDVGGYVNLALCIRTLVHDGRTYRTRASAGIVTDSDAEREWIETLAKSGAAVWAVTDEELL